MTVAQAKGAAPDFPEPSDQGVDEPVIRAHHPAVGLLATAAVIAVPTIVLWWRLLGAFTFMMDDLTQFDVANRMGLSSDLLLMNVAQHFGPLNRMAHLLELRVAQLDLTTVAIVVTGLVACLLMATAWLTFELGMSLVRRLLVLAATGTALSVIDSAVWNDASLHIIGALTATYLVLALHLRGIRKGQWIWHVAAVAVFATGLLIQERVGLALPLVVFFDMFLLWRDETIGQRFRRLWAVKWPLLAMTGAAGVAAYWIHANYVAANAPGFSPGPALRTALLALTGYQFPQLVGYQPVTALSSTGQLAALLVILLVFALLIVMNRRNAGPVLLFVATFAMYWGFLVFSPMVNDGVIQANAERVQNAAYVTVPALIAIFSLDGPSKLAAALRGRASRRATVAVQAGVICLLVIAMVLAGNGYTADNWTRYRSAHQFWEGVQNSRDVWTDPAVTVIPLQAPDSVAQEWATIYGRQEFLLPLFERGWAPGNLTDHPIVLTADGQVRDVALQKVSGTSPATGAPSSCLQPAAYTDAYSFRLDQPATTGPVLLRMHYTSDLPGQVVATPSSNGAVPQWDWPVGLSAGTHQVVIPLPLNSVDSLQLSDITPGSGLCLNGLEIVRPLIIDPDGSCWVLDQYGVKTGEQTSCPTVG